LSRPSNKSLILTEEVCKTYHSGRPDEVRAVVGASLRIERGEVAVLKGPSGSGKTSLLSLVGCMSRPTSGRIFVGGRDVAKLPEKFLTEVRRRTFGFIFQQFNLIRDISVLENVLLPLYPVEMPLAAMRKRAENLLDRLGLSGKRRIHAGKLSGGEQQRVAIARALVNEPEILVADEPTAHLDSRLAGELMAILGDLHEEGKTIVIATHDPFVFDHPLVGRTIAMHDGTIIGVTVK
jgi:putative ABC transport system ATP-binding protein